MPRPEKVAAVAEIKERIEGAQGVFLAEYAGLSVKQQQELRRGLLEQGAEFKVVKMTLARRAAADLDLEDLDELLVGPTGIAFADQDAVSAAKVLKEFASSHEVFSIKGGLLGMDYLTPERISELAEIAPREVLLSMLAGAMKAPLTTMAGLLAALPRGAATVFQQLLEKKESGEYVSEDAADAATAAAEEPAAEAEVPADEASEDAEPAEASGDEAEPAEAPEKAEPAEAEPADEAEASSDAAAEAETPDEVVDASGGADDEVAEPAEDAAPSDEAEPVGTEPADEAEASSDAAAEAETPDEVVDASGGADDEVAEPAEDAAPSDEAEAIAEAETGDPAPAAGADAEPEAAASAEADADEESDDDDPAETAEEEK